MIVLLPPSENKATRTRGARLDLATLSWSDQLTDARRVVIDTVAAASAAANAPEILGVSLTLMSDIARNTRLLTAPTTPVSALYTGVLYDALDVDGLSRSAKLRAARRLVVSSAVYGALRLGDRVAPYRLSMGINLPGVGPLASFWKAHLETPLTEAAGRGIIVDCRSSTYAASWTPSGDQQQRWVHVRVPGATHMAKHTRGLLTRHLMECGTDPRTPTHLADLAELAFDVDLHEPASVTKPWILDVRARGD